jgi:hypothetical protein
MMRKISGRSGGEHCSDRRPFDRAASSCGYARQLRSEYPGRSPQFFGQLDRYAPAQVEMHGHSSQDCAFHRIRGSSQQARAIRERRSAEPDNRAHGPVSSCAECQSTPLARWALPQISNLTKLNFDKA